MTNNLDREYLNSEVIAFKRSIQRLILELNITEYAALMHYLDKQNMCDEYDIVNNHACFFVNFIASVRNMKKEGEGSNIYDYFRES